MRQDAGRAWSHGLGPARQCAAGKNGDTALRAAIESSLARRKAAEQTAEATWNRSGQLLDCLLPDECARYLVDSGSLQAQRISLWPGCSYPDDLRPTLYRLTALSAGGQATAIRTAPARLTQLKLQACPIP